MMTDSTNARPVMPLPLVTPGETAELVEIRLNGDEKQRLHELGLVPGTLIRVIQSDLTSGMIVAVRQDGRLALNRSTAQKLLVRLER